MYLRLSQIYNFVKGDANSRNMCEGEEVLKSGQIVTVGCSKVTMGEKEITALVLQTSSMSSFPHTVVGILSTGNDSLSIKSMKCSCKAGLGGICKHVVAVLLFIERNDLNKLEDLSCTDLKFAWAERKTTAQTNFTPSAARELCCVKVPVKDYTNGEVDFETLLDQVLSINEKSAMYLSAKGRNTTERRVVQENPGCLEESLKHVIEHVLNNETLIKYATSFNVTGMSDCCCNKLQNLEVSDPLTICCATARYRDVWNKERQFRVSGTRIYGLFTYAKNKNPDWEEKSQNYFWPKAFTPTAPIRHGLQHEKHAREAYEENYNVRVIQTGLIIHPALCWVGFSPDGIVSGENGPEKLLEIKCIYEGKNKNINECLNTCTFLQKDHTLKKRHTYYAQVQLGMLLLDLKKCDFVIYASFDKSMYVTEVTFDESFAINMILTVQEVYLKKMVHFICLHNSEREQDQDPE